MSKEMIWKSAVIDLTAYAKGKKSVSLLYNGYLVINTFDF